MHSAHERLGPIVRIAPSEISVNSVENGIRTIYSGGFEKGDWYKNIFSNYGVQPMFAMPYHGDHSKRKRMLSNIYAKSTLQGSASMTAITNILLNERFVPRLRELVKAMGNEGVEFYDIFSAATMDFVAAYVFGLKNGTNYLQDPSMGQKFFRDFKARQRHSFWPQDLPRFTEVIYATGLMGWLIPKWVKKANKDIEAWLLGMCDEAEADVRQAEVEGEKGRAEDWPSVYAQLRGALLKESEKSDADGGLTVEERVRRRRLNVASEMLDHALAGFDTSSITLTFLAWELSKERNAEWQEKLREELTSLEGRRDAKELDNLPILHAIVMETLRLHAAIPGNQPRITPSPSCALGDTDHTTTSLPPNIRVQAQAWSLHRNPSVFPDPECWLPSRWLESSEAQMREMQRWFWAFGSGGRMCVGSNLAMLDMKAIIAGIWAEFKTSVVDGDGMVHNGGYVAEPVGKEGRYLVLKVEDLRSGS